MSALSGICCVWDVAGLRTAGKNKNKAAPPNRHSIIQKCQILTIARPGKPPFISELHPREAPPNTLYNGMRIYIPTIRLNM